MRIGFLTYPGAPLSRGGVYQQIVRTARCIEAFSSGTVNFVNTFDHLAGLDVLHVFSIEPCLLPVVRYARERRIPVVVSPIFMDAVDPFPRLLAMKLRMLANVRGGGLMAAREILMTSSVILPMLRAEGDGLEAIFGPVPCPRVTVPNLGRPDVLERADRGPREFLLFVGVIEARKQVLEAIRLSKGLGLPLKVVGHANSVNGRYLEQCIAAGGSTTEFLGHVPSDSSFLRGLYAQAVALVLLSKREVAPLVIREAAFQGTPTCVSDGLANQDDFEPYVLRSNGRVLLTKRMLSEFDRGLAERSLQSVPTDREIAELLAAVYCSFAQMESFHCVESPLQ